MSLAYGKEIVAGIAPAQRDTTPLGTIIAFMGTTAPDLYLACDGSVYNIVDYPDFAEFLDEQFGSVGYFGGDGTTTFAVPDLRGEFLRGTGTNGHSNQGNGADVGEHQDGTRHVGVVAYGTSSNNIGVAANNDSASSTPSDQDNIVQKDAYICASSLTRNVLSTKSNSYSSYTSRPTNTSVNYCIKVKLSGLEFVEREELQSYKNMNVGKYSTQAIRTGTWIDGKPLYSREFVFSNVTADDTIQTIAHEIPNVDIIMVNGGAAISSTGKAYSMNGSSVSCDVDRTNIYIKIGESSLSTNTVYVSVKFTLADDNLDPNDNITISRLMEDEF